ncbi:adenylyl-sulfate kinase [Paludisphaera sp.]|uniref:adenylyl-sulfate kinase n=1 Tax=Paludisphaera sp. TaxID=2017432 RepID=UPI00301DCA8A
MSARDPGAGAPIPPHGGHLVDLIVDAPRAAAMKAESPGLASVTLDGRGVADLELLSVGGYSPLTSFMGKADHDRVIAEMRLANGTPWPLPIVRPVEPGEGVAEGKPLALRDVYGNLLAFLHVAELFQPEGVAGHYAAGRLEVVRTPPHYDFVDLRRTPAELRARFRELGWSRVLAFHADAPIHRAEEEAIRRAAEWLGAGLLIHAAVGAGRPGDVDRYARVRCHRALVDGYFDPAAALLALLPLATPPADARGTLLRALVARNYGCTDLIVDQDLEYLSPHAEEIGVGLVAAPRMIYLPDKARHEAVEEIPAGARTATLSDAQVRDDYLAKGIPLPDWFTRPEVATILGETHPPRHRQGLTIWFTGLSGSGKSTVAQALLERMAEHGRAASFLDGDEIRTHLSKGLGFSKEDRDVNIRRVGYVAGLVARHGGVTICSVISPYKAVRDEARAASGGNFVEVYCSTPVEVCESRDVKGFYAKARAAMEAGKPLGFTGVDDPYEAPEAAEVTLDTSRLGVADCVDAVVAKLMELGYIQPVGRAPR